MAGQNTKVILGKNENLVLGISFRMLRDNIPSICQLLTLSEMSRLSRVNKELHKQIGHLMSKTEEIELETVQKGNLLLTVTGIRFLLLDYDLYELVAFSVDIRAGNLASFTLSGSFRPGRKGKYALLIKSNVCLYVNNCRVQYIASYGYRISSLKIYSFTRNIDIIDAINEYVNHVVYRIDNGIIVHDIIAENVIRNLYYNYPRCKGIVATLIDVRTVNQILAE